VEIFVFVVFGDEHVPESAAKEQYRVRTDVTPFMNSSSDLLDQRSHFAFGKNWASYAKLVSDLQIDDAVSALRALAGGSLEGRRFLDIGSGSGLHALAALRLGSAEVVSLDIDPDAVATTRKLLQVHAARETWRVELRSIFDLEPASVGQFDVVYSWGVLHHTGDMYGAIRAAAALLAPGGQLILALYRHTRLCWFWKIEKRWYAHASARSQRLAQMLFIALRRFSKGSKFKQYVASYPERYRGMDFYHDVHDWLGGWPYESITPAQADKLMRELGLRKVRVFARAGIPLGVFGSGCDEYVYVRA
jgi:2-polyprenyl-3-methyl-5-hydroxy-6-metoxy-1,4-benzoquinol methylase